MKLGLFNTLYTLFFVKLFQKKQRMENAREVLFNNIVKKRSRGGVEQE
jgi:hypothetical protein